MWLWLRILGLVKFSSLVGLLWARVSAALAEGCWRGEELGFTGGFGVKSWGAEQRERENRDVWQGSLRSHSRNQPHTTGGV